MLIAVVNYAQPFRGDATGHVTKWRKMERFLYDCCAYQQISYFIGLCQCQVIYAVLNAVEQGILTPLKTNLQIYKVEPGARNDPFFNIGYQSRVMLATPVGCHH